jgi:hypothetical protein
MIETYEEILYFFTEKQCTLCHYLKRGMGDYNLIQGIEN